MQKIQLKQQAKSLLLKGCYKMASNKYARLIQMGSEGLSQREWSVVHLNQAICYHFLQELNQALQLSSRAVEIDPTYQKAYYRRIQILRDMRELDSALHSIPSWVRNQEIENLLTEIREEYFNSLGIDQMLRDLTSEKQTKLEHAKESHQHFYQKLLAFAEEETSSKTIQSIGAKIAMYYTQLRNYQDERRLESFLAIIHKLNVKMCKQIKYRGFVEPLLQQFWREYLQNSQPARADLLSIQQLSKQEFKLMKYAPNCPQVVRFLSLLTSHPQLQSSQLFEWAIQIASNLSSSPLYSNLGPQVLAMVECVISGLSKTMCHSRLAWLKRSFILLDSLVKLHLHFQPNLCLKEITLTTAVYLRYDYINKGSEAGQTPLFKVSQQALFEFLSSNLEDFVVIFIFEQFLHKLDRNTFKQILPLIQEQMELSKEIASIQKGTKRNHPVAIEMQQEFKLVYTSIILKIDLKHASTNISISSLLSQKHNRKTLYDQSLSDIMLNTLLLLALSNAKNLVEIVGHPHSITNIMHEFAISTFIQQLQSVNIATSFIYLVMIDLEHQQSEAYAKKMGVGRQEIEKARKIQGESQDPKLSKQLVVKREQFVEYAAHHWIDIIFNLSTTILKIKEDTTLAKWSKIVNQIAKINTSHFHHPKVVQVMLEAFKLDKAVVGQFFSLLCKKVNTNLLKYEQMQSIGDVLIYTIQNGEHELVIFQSLLGLINLTSNSNSKIKIPIKVLQNCLFEENKYIVHGALELLNNVLINFEKEEIDKHASLKEVIGKYLSYYRQEAVSVDETVPLNDYSHPCKVYSTLISVAIVMDLQTLQVFQSWEQAQKCLLSIRTPRAITFFKIAMYMGMKQRLHGKWWKHFDKQLIQLKDTNRGFWSKLQQYMR